MLTFFHDTTQEAPQQAAHWAEDMRGRLEPSLNWRVYVDGAWRSTPSPTLDNYILDDNAHVGSGCIVITVSQATGDQASILVVLLPADQLDAEHCGQLFFLSLTGGLQLLSHLQLQGKVITDCQRLTQKLDEWDVLRRRDHLECNLWAPDGAYDDVP